ncbi:hypothetical protein J5N97_007833 [Dioscorea zingiberensis]|uniref:Myb/SANT-like DNA-binding domain-containing protein n=1 Tax=Dioscorea zingiberensis TaxID=325984 RepID=A0A9D5HW22_9LILI|nr:hypothetical protein J5N97_007833 [Dioscorea zingiberensis]
MDNAQGFGTTPPEPESSLPAPRLPDKSRRDEWSEGGVLSLLEFYESKWVLRNRAKLKGSDWEDIAREVSVRCSGTKALKTPSQCKNKIESMKKRYRAESALAHLPNSCSSWQFYARMDNLLKGTTNSPAQLRSENNVDLQAPPKVEADMEVDGRLQDSNRDDASNTLPVNLNACIDNGDNHGKKVCRGTDSDVSAPRCVADGVERANDRAKRKKRSGSEVAESIRLLAHSILKIEQARLEVYKDSERMRVEADIKRGEMELKRTRIIAKTQLQIARLFSKRSRRRGKSSDNLSTRTEVDEAARDGMDD